MKRAHNLFLTSILAVAVLTAFVRRGAAQQCCTRPTSETIGATPIADPGTLTQSKFYTVVSNSAGDNFAGRFVRESAGSGTNIDNCYFFGSAVAPAGLTGGTWQVGGGNQYAYDTVGWGYDAVDYYRFWGPQHGIIFPCNALVYQTMLINCPVDDPNQYITYLENNILESTIFDDGHVTNCRIGVCHTINY
jgi:hypothetical protein